MSNEQKNVYVVEVDMKNKSVEDIAREATLQIIGIMNALVERQKQAEEAQKERNLIAIQEDRLVIIDKLDAKLHAISDGKAPSKAALWRGIDYHHENRTISCKGEFRSVCQVVGGINAMINEECEDKDALALVKYISENQKEEKILANQQVIKTPIVRNGKQATVGYIS